MGRAVIPFHCARCGVEFHRAPSRAAHGRAKYCGRQCQYTALKEAPKMGEARKCLSCGREFVLPPSKIAKAKGAGKYCSRACRDDHWRGDVVPNWQGGNGVYKRGSRWQAIKRAVRRRDGGCVVCLTPEDLHVHHKIPFRMFDDADTANQLDNLVTLCAKHHREEDARWKWVRVGETIIRFAAGGYAWWLARERGLVGEFS